jgi:hypothetical protein
VFFFDCWADFLWPTVEYYGSNGMCYPLHITDPFSNGWQFSAMLFIGVNLAGSVL